RRRRREAAARRSPEAGRELGRDDDEERVDGHQGHRARVEDAARQLREDHARRDGAERYLRPRGQGPRRVPQEEPAEKVKRVLVRLEDAIGSLALLVMVVLPLAEIVSRRACSRGIPGSGPIVQHLPLWVGFLGAAIASRDGKLLALATGTFIPPGIWRRAAEIFAAAFGACAAVILAWGGWQMVMIEREAGTIIGADIQAWVAQLVLPISFALIAARIVWRPGFNALNPATEDARLKPSRSSEDVASAQTADRRSAKASAERNIWIDRALAAVGIAAGIVLVRAPSLVEGHSLVPVWIVIVVAAVAGTPLFAILGGTAALLFLHDGVPSATIMVETYSLSVSPTLPAIPLFTLAGFLLAEGRASERL